MDVPPIVKLSLIVVVLMNRVQLPTKASNDSLNYLNTKKILRKISIYMTVQCPHSNWCEFSFFSLYQWENFNSTMEIMELTIFKFTKLQKKIK